MAASQGKRRLPPGPKGWPLVGHLFEFRRDPISFLTRLAREHGDVARFSIGRQMFVQVSDPDLIRDVLVTNHRNFKKTGVLQRLRPLLGNGLVTADGEVHHRQRRLMQPPLNKQRVNAYADLFVASAQQHAQSWRSGQQVDMFQEMLHLTLGIVTRTLFSSDLHSDAIRIEESLNTVINHVAWLVSPVAGLLARLPLPANRRFQHAVKALDSIVYRMIDERRRSAEHGDDLLSMLVLAQDVEGSGGGMSDTQIRDEVMTLFTAGHETVATALTWTWYALAQNPAVYDRLGEELDRVLSGALPTAEDVPNLAYVKMVFAESMRLFPPVWAMTRLTIEACEMGGYHIPAGSVIGLSQYVVHHDPRLFPEPEKFDPLRWTAEAESSRLRYAYFPFGGGPRLCIGEPFAWLEGVLVLATLCRQWRPALPPDHKIEFDPTITLRPKHGMPLLLEARHALPRPAQSLEVSFP